MSLTIGDKLPELTLAASGGKTISLAKDFKGKKLVVYFYPKDNTPGCTVEGQEFTGLYADFVKAGADIVGVSKDSVKSHDNFCTKFGFPFTLLSDGDEAMCNAFGVIVEKSMYGKKYMGIDRCTFLFDSKGKLVKDWRKVSAKGHAAEVLEAVTAL
ncbi:peroxiredoxin [uncultured Nevskia sp.]|uniref:peroxiredoxin n=1 Tax=uncultured Nevskia sp. TaxID=228950 RepID=UPI0025DA5DB2|nr:peroxiredoxin [uncultured Nevskia sp.]